MCDADVDNQCRLWLVYLFSSFFIPASQMAMCGKLCHYLINLDKLDTLNWEKYIHSQLFHNMAQCKDSVLARESESRQTYPYIFGCVMILNVYYKVASYKIIGTEEIDDSEDEEDAVDLEENEGGVRDDDKDEESFKSQV